MSKTNKIFINIYTSSIFLFLFLLSGCSFDLVNYENLSNKNFQLVFSENIPNKFQNKIRATISSDNSKKTSESNTIKVSEFMMSAYDVFAGKALRSLEVEVKSSVMISISINKKTINKKLNTMKRYSSSELNILAEDEMLDFIRNEIYDEFVNQLIFEVGLIEM